ncbi:MAG: class II fructose-bisphosphate aldolase [Nocardiopsaceae bacterium]|jgi:fructose-bisphosphate aldolase class II|nr:class II fructose-bisphosphate aldolase [Nocardiopsaceae bacterium]
MTAAGTAEIIAMAQAEDAGVGAFNLISIEHAEAVVAGAEQARRPVVLQISENCVKYHGALEPIALAALAIGRAAAVPVAVHLDHATSSNLVEQAAGLGIGSVMFDASALDYEENVAVTARLAAWCRARGVWVEAELGEIGGKDGVHAPGVRTKPEDAAAFAVATGVDALAVAVGSSHAMLTRDAVLDFDLIGQIRAQVPGRVPLVLHGSSGVSDAALGKAILAGMTKINIATQLNKVFTSAVRERLAADELLVDPRRYGAAGREAVAAEVARLLRVLSP